MSEIRFPLPDVGEGLTEAEIVQWRVAPGDRIALDQVFVEIETAKSLVELPSAFEGVVSELLVDEGKTVDVGTPILVIQTDARRCGCRDVGSLGRGRLGWRAPRRPNPRSARPSRRTPPRRPRAAEPCSSATDPRAPRPRVGSGIRHPAARTRASRPSRRPPPLPRRHRRRARRQVPRPPRRRLPLRPPRRVPTRACPSSRSRRSASSRRTSASTSRASRPPGRSATSPATT